MNLAIKGHRTRGGEVIQLLEMLGGVNKHQIGAIRETYVYFVDIDGIIRLLPINQLLPEQYISYSLEEFEEKFPYKVGDKVSSKYLKNYKIEKIEWEDTSNRVIYKLQGMGWYSVDELQPYKEEIMEERKYADLRLDVDQDDKLATEATIDGDKITPPENYLIGKITKVDNGVLVEFVKKQSQYPKTYDKCCTTLGYDADRVISFDTQTFKTDALFENLYKLYICRNAYWKVYGDIHNLDKPWEPDWTQQTTKYCIWNCKNKVDRFAPTFTNFMLTFPTSELRDIFYENFKDLIEQCKELL